MAGGAKLARELLEHRHLLHADPARDDRRNQDARHDPRKPGRDVLRVGRQRRHRLVIRRALHRGDALLGPLRHRLFGPRALGVGQAVGLTQLFELRRPRDPPRTRRCPICCIGAHEDDASSRLASVSCGITPESSRDAERRSSPPEPDELSTNFKQHPWHAGCC